MLQFEIEAPRKEIAQLCADRKRAVVVARAQRFLDETVRAAGERDQALGAAGEVVEPRARITFAAAQLRQRNDLAQVRVALRVLDEQHDARRMRGHFACRPCRTAGPDRFGTRRFERKFGAANRRQLLLFRGLREADRAVEPVAIGQRDAGQARCHGRAHQFFGVRGALEEREVRPGVEFGVARGSSHGPLS